MSVFSQSDPADRAQSTRSFVLGSALMCVAYVIPFVGFIMWTLAGVFGLGAATLAFYSSYRRENPKPPKKAPVVPPPAPLDPTPPIDTAAPAAPAAFQGVDSAPFQTAAESMPLPQAEPVEAPRGHAIAFPKAEFLERLAALVLDVIAIAIMVQLLSLDHRGDFGDRLMVFFALMYHVGFWTWKGTTPGGMICQLRIVRVDGKKLEFPESLVRGLTGIFSLAVVGLGFLWMLRDPERQTWHDRVAGTYVVKVPRAYPI
jgi:uncharacterized RDD family membrane protein YckC